MPYLIEQNEPVIVLERRDDESPHVLITPETVRLNHGSRATPKHMDVVSPEIEHETSLADCASAVATFEAPGPREAAPLAKLRLGITATRYGRARQAAPTRFEPSTHRQSLPE